jgi:hypothetical protein
MLDDAAVREAFQAELRGIIAKLGEPGASERAAVAVADFAFGK